MRGARRQLLYARNCVSVTYTPDHLGILLQPSDTIAGQVIAPAIQVQIESLKNFFHHAKRILLKWLNRRSQKQSYTWDGFNAALDRYKVPKPRITDYKRARTPGETIADAFDGSEYSEEPGAHVTPRWRSR